MVIEANLACSNDHRHPQHLDLESRFGCLTRPFSPLLPQRNGNQRAKVPGY